jgi:FAD/FMN-containing dehydrogenase/Fe-S oxidoreductase
MHAATREMLHDLQHAVDDTAFDQMTRLLYSTDASIYQMMPVGVVFPKNTDEIAAAVEIANQHGVPVLPRGGGSSLAGQGVNHALVLDLTRHMRNITYVDPDAQIVTVQAGMTLGALNRALAVHGYQYGPDPASADRAAVGGVIGNNATGAHSIQYGMTADNVASVRAVLADGTITTLSDATDWHTGSQLGGIEGQIYRMLPTILERYADAIHTDYPETFRTVAGYNLDRLAAAATPNLAELIVGSEGTLAVVGQATLKMVPIPRVKCLALVHFADLRAALEAVPPMLEAQPSAIELLDKMLLDLTRNNAEYSRKLTFVEGDPAAIQMVEFAAESDAEVRAGVQRLKERLRALGHRGAIVELHDTARQADVWAIRKAGLGILMSMRGDSKPIPVIEDAAVPVEHLADYIDGVMEVCQQAGVTEVAVYAHASAGCLHVRPRVNLKTADGVQQLREIGEGAAELVRSFQGTISGEHGTGIARSEFIDDVLGPDLAAAFREVKAAFDPHNRMNPGKIVDPPPMDDETLLRFGSGYATPLEPADTVISFEGDGGFAMAVEMCNGAGVCRKEHSGVMCPSYMVTKDEAHATRGRANALRAAMNGHLGPKGMTDDALYEVLDLCFSCKACQTECPTSVDMARMKAVFLHNYHQEKGVPLRSRLFANIAKLNKLSQPVAPIANLMLKGPAKWAMSALGVHPERTLPSFAAQPFTAWWRKRGGSQGSGQRGEVVFFHDTFLQHNEPQIGQAAVQVLEAMGFSVIVEEKRGCCGRPAMSKGLLEQAKRQGQQVVETLAPYAERGIPIVGCEPSCIGSLTDEYPDLIEHPQVRAVAEASMLFDRFVLEHSEHLTLKSLDSAVLFHGHCHQKALYGAGATVEMLRLIPGAEVTLIDSTCCGMAGSFGYETEHYEVSIQSAELTLAPAIREAPEQTIICATGTSCREQIHHTTQRTAQHPIVVLAEALA